MWCLHKWRVESFNYMEPADVATIRARNDNLFIIATQGGTAIYSRCEKCKALKSQVLPGRWKP